MDDFIERVFNHIVLPPSLPGGQDADVDNVGYRLLGRLGYACGSLECMGDEKMALSCKALASSLAMCQRMAQGTMSASTLLESFALLNNPDGLVILDIKEQNAGLVLRRITEPDGGTSVVFEAFEASPPTEDVLAASGNLAWRFPSRAVKVPHATFADPDFQSALAAFLEKASAETVASLAAKATKAGVSVTEVRNTCSPALITHMLLSLLQGIGSPAQVAPLQKRVRDDVSFKDTKMPFRRCPVWLVLRVAAQRHLCCCLGPGVGYVAYKALMCLLLSHLLDDCVRYQLHPGRVSLLQKKLGRKLAKLERRGVDAALSDDDTRTARQLMDATSDTFEASIDAASAYMKAQLAIFKQESLRKVPPLPRRVDDRDLSLSLPTSGSYLDRIADQPVIAPSALHTAPGYGSNLNSDPAIQSTRAFTQRVAVVAETLRRATTEAETRRLLCEGGMREANAHTHCSRAADTIAELLALVQPRTADNADLNSAAILAIFDQWAVLDRMAVLAHPMLAEYDPVFAPSLLDVLQLPDLASMQRLRRIQAYLRKRQAQSAFPDRTVFSATLDGSCFGARYATASVEHTSLRDQIKRAQDTKRETKQREWDDKAAEYDRLSTELDRWDCSCTFVHRWRDYRGCRRCGIWRERKRITIEACEDLLPNTESTANAILFELKVPACIGIYRSASWSIVARLAHPDAAPRIEGKRLHQTAVGAFGTFSVHSHVSLVSTVKAYEDTHYDAQHMKVPLEQVLLPFGPRFQLCYRSQSTFLISSFKKPLTLAHLCHVHIPDAVPTTVMRLEPHPPAQPEGPSSYEAVAHRSECPAELSVHEFEAIQRLLSGVSRRWLTMVVELGCSNVHFGKQDAMLLFKQLAHQAGPQLDADASGARTVRTAGRDAGDVAHRACLGTCHQLFAEEAFVERLLAEVAKRLRSIHNNWREANTMALVVALLLRTRALLGEGMPVRLLDTARALLESARATTVAWMDALHDELMKAVDDKAAQRTSACAMWAALLCRQTFAPLAEEGSEEMSADDLSVFVRASISLQQNLVVRIDALPALEQCAFQRDATMADKLRGKIASAVGRHPAAMNDAVGLCSGLQRAGASVHIVFEPWAHLTGGSDGWVAARCHMSGAQHLASAQAFCFHLTQGHLLVDGKTVGKLPDDIRDSDDVKALLGNKNLLTYPSNMPNMSHRLIQAYENHMIHFGRVDGRVVVLAIPKSNEVHEYVPRRVFVGADGGYDLPRGLVDGCFHWFNHSTGCVDIRRDNSGWFTRDSNWRLDVRERRARRRDVLLVDRFSEPFRQVAGVFEGFEDVQRLTVFQPIKSGGSLSVELRHLDLSFYVNRFRHLECRELLAEVDPNQDAGTLYGYRSMIVLRDVRDATRRCIIAPLGGMRWSCFRGHISVSTTIGTTGGAATGATGAAGAAGATGPGGSSAKAYARFDIDGLLGRLTCPPELRLLYTKAQLHAFTSYPLPDPLTGRTGEEEAFHTLLSGRCQPWTSLPPVCLDILDQIRKLAPRRAYYPEQMRVLQRVTWDGHLPFGMQNDRYGRIVRDIVAKADSIRQFEEAGQSDIGECYAKWFAESDRMAPRDLADRGECQRLRYECPRDDVEPACPVQSRDKPHRSRGLVPGISATATQNAPDTASAVFQVTAMLANKTQSIPLRQDMSEMLQQWEVIGGFHDAVDVYQAPISTLMDPRTMQGQWGGLVEHCRAAEGAGVYRAMFTLACLAFCPDSDMDAVRLLAAYVYLAPLRGITPPRHVSYTRFAFRQDLSKDDLLPLIEKNYVEYVPDAIAETGWDRIQLAIRRGREAHRKACRAAGQRWAAALMSGWPHKETPAADGFTSPVIHVAGALDDISPVWERFRRSRDLSAYVAQAEAALSPYRTHPRKGTKLEAKRQPRPSAAHPLQSQPQTMPRLTTELVARPVRTARPATAAPARLPRATLGGSQRTAQPASAGQAFAELRQIIAPFTQSPDPLRQQYGRDLDASLTALEQHARAQNTEQSAAADAAVSEATLLPHLEAWQQAVASALSQAQDTLSDDGRGWLQRVGLWPRLTRVAVLELLRSSARHRYGAGMKQMLVHLGEALAACQRWHRILRAVQKDDRRRMHEELANDGHTNWQPVDNPDWLLLEVDAGLLIRDEQVVVARAMNHPASGANSVSQLNMGKGKTSVILPMVLSVLADGDQLARLIVPKALILPTAQILQARMGGLVGREVRHVAFSRRLITGEGGGSMVHAFQQHHEQLVQSRGVFLAAPENIMAFKLCGQQCLADGKGKQAREMIEFQTRLETSMCRDVLDESDFTLAVRTQLVYPSGQLSLVDGAPSRWKLVQDLLQIVEDSLPMLQEEYPFDIAAVRRPGGGFPMIHILHTDIEHALHRCIVQGICNGRVAFFRPHPVPGKDAAAGPAPPASPDETKRLLRTALHDAASDGDISRAARLFANAQQAVADGLLLVQGLLKHGILVTCLKKRWNVQYGLHPRRWPIAVPFEARGVPSERSEFGHPDVSIIFTCLSFYYAGITLEQFRHSLDHVLRHVDDPATEYEKLAAGDGNVRLPEALQHWSAINIDDKGQVATLWQHLRFTRAAINHHLNMFVFPLHCRQFSVKLQVSAWDLPLVAPAAPDNDGAAKRGARTTGFSGTNDNKALLPLTIQQNDLPRLQHTNAEVLTYLLAPRNRHYVCMATAERRWTEGDFLQSMRGNDIGVLIDAGAYILEKRNEELARDWLRVADGRKYKAAVFFGEDDNRAWVLFRDTSAGKAPLVSTPFADNLNECLVYFDEAHTRGVDLPLPPHTRGALTLALGQTKDHTMQAAMRLRQLGSTQSVTFYAPPEVDVSIHDQCGLRKKEPASSLSSPHVLSWLLEQTCTANAQLRSLYVAHGLDFCRRTDASWRHRGQLGGKQSRKALLKVLEQPERQTLQVMYGGRLPGGDGDGDAAAGNSHAPLAQPALQAMADALRAAATPGTGASCQPWNGQIRSAFEEVEQEREVEVQVEQERVGVRRKRYVALRFPGKVSASLRRFVKRGTLLADLDFEGVFANMAQTGIGERYGVKAVASQLFVTREFGKTIAERQFGRHAYDNFLRHVEWLLWCPSTETGIVVIPEELELLLPDILASRKVHLMAYASPVTKDMQDFSSLKYLSIPPLPRDYVPPAWLPIELGILAGRLYMSFSETRQMAAYLAKAAAPPTGQSGGTAKPWCADPEGFLLEWLALQRATQDIMHTPAAYICQGRTLRYDHAFFTQGPQTDGSEGTEWSGSSNGSSNGSSRVSSNGAQYDDEGDYAEVQIKAEDRE